MVSDVHAHEDPSFTGGIEPASPVIERGQLEPNPLEAPGQLDRLIRRDASVDTCDDPGAFQGAVGEFNNGHETAKD